MTDVPTRMLAIGCVLLAALIAAEFAWPSGEDAANPVMPRRTAAAPPILSPARSAPVDSLLATTLARPLFSPTRRPEAGQGDSAAADLTDKRLAGIVIDPDRRLAIFAVNGGKPLTLSVGETVDGWRVEQISATEVSLSGVGGTRTLQPKIDPNLVRQPNPPQPLGALATTGANAPVQPPLATAPGARFPPIAANRPGRAGMPAPALPGAPPGPPPGAQPGPPASQPSSQPGRAGKQ